MYGLSETGLITGCYEGAFKHGSSGVLTIGTRLKVCILICPVRSIKKGYNSSVLPNLIRHKNVLIAFKLSKLIYH